MLSATVGTSSTDSVAASTDSSPTQLSDACALLALMVRSQATTQASSKTDVELDFKKLQELKQRLADAIQKAKDAADNAGFWGFLGNVFGSDVAQIAGAVAAAAAIVATGGAAAPLIVMAVSVALEEAAKIGASLGLDPKICMAIGLAGAALGLCSGAGTTQAAGTITTVAREVKFGAECVQGSAIGTGSTLGYVSQHYHGEQLGYQADAIGYHAQNDATNLDFDAAIALLQQALRTEQRETNTGSAIVQNDSNTSSNLSDRI